jgi:chromosome segregation ATPase
MRNLKDDLEAIKARWEAAEGRVAEYRKKIRDMKVQLDAMSGAKCASAEHKAMQELRAMPKRLDAQYSVMAGAGSPMREMNTRKSELDDQVRRRNTRIEECEREIGLLRSSKASLEGRIAKMEQRRRSGGEAGQRW